MHQIAFFASLPAGIALIALASGVEARVAASIFAACLSGLYGVSALYHRRDWSERATRVMRHLDHSMIFVFIAASYTPVTLLALRPAWGIALLAMAWSGAASASSSRCSASSGGAPWASSSTSCWGGSRSSPSRSWSDRCRRSR